MTKEEEKEYKKQWYIKNKDILKEKNKKYREENKEYFSEYNKKYREENKEYFSEYNKKYYEENKEEITEYLKKWREENKEYLLEYFKNYSTNNKEKRNKYRDKYASNNPDKIKKINKDYLIRNKDKRKLWYNEYRKNKRKNDILFKLKDNIRCIIRFSYVSKGYKKNSKTFEILGCSYEEFRVYIESKFEPWMTWDNHGCYTGEYNETWQYDHIIPISSALTEGEIIKLNHYTNFQPLCSRINLEKSNKINMFAASNTVKNCYVACSPDKINSGQCSCYNRVAGKIFSGGFSVNNVRSIKVKRILDIINFNLPNEQ